MNRQILVPELFSAIRKTDLVSSHSINLLKLVAIASIFSLTATAEGSKGSAYMDMKAVVNGRIIKSA